MFPVAEKIILAGGWRRCLFAFLAGATGALAMAPVDFFPAMIVPMTVAVWLIDGSTVLWDKKTPLSAGFFSMNFSLSGFKSAAWAGWWWGFGYFVAGLWWLGAAFLVEADQFAWALPLGVLGLPAVLAFFPALGFGLARLLWSPGAGRVFALAAGLTLSEWLRAHMFTGFPWNAFGMALGGNLVTAQLASVIGLHGLTVVTIVIFALPALSYARRSSALPFAGEWRRKAYAPIGLCLAALAAIGGFGAIRLANSQPGVVEGVRLRIMQPDLAQDEKFSPANKAAILAHYLSLSNPSKTIDSDDFFGTTVLVWPESAFPFILSRDATSLAEIGASLPYDTFLLTGAARAEKNAAFFDDHLDYFNSIHVIASGGTILDSYDKVHLVPFGEYLPFAALLEQVGLHHFVHIPGGFTPGSQRRLIHVPGIPPIAPLICYEAIFPDEVIPARDGPQEPGFFVNVTNDAWFGQTAGPYQHFAQARLRAIEAGLPLVRAANTGISAIIDPFGRVMAELPLGAEGLLEGSLPRKIQAPIFTRSPFLAAFLVWLASFIAAVTLRRSVCS
ncbi:MAG TPA: apolipoprotein N-acyltransferase [Beijerinckia sp.]|nr:apolipoprotein N-acyltransferase [Beijerinckia sp.]